MTHYTRRDVEGQAVRLARAATTIGLLPAGATLALTPGSATNGIAWTITTPDRRGRNFLNLDLGRTAADAFHRIHAAALALEAVAERSLTIDCDGTCPGCRNGDGCYAEPGETVRNGRIVRR